MWKKSEPVVAPPEKPPAQAPQPPKRPPEPAAAPCAKIGSSIAIQGQLIGDEDLLILGQIEGRVEIRQHNVTVGAGGRVKADIRGHTVIVEGEVEGSLIAEELVVVRSTGRVRGDIISPRVTLDDGAGFRGRIDMEGNGANRSPEEESLGAALPDLPVLPEDLGAHGDLVFGRILD